MRDGNRCGIAFVLGRADKAADTVPPQAAPITTVHGEIGRPSPQRKPGSILPWLTSSFKPAHGNDYPK